MLRHDDPLIHGIVDVVDLLIVLMTLAGQNDDVAALGVIHGVVDGLHPVGDGHIGRVGVPHTHQNVVDDGLRLLGAGVVAGDNDKVRQPCGDAAHDGALRLIPVAAAAEQHHGAALGKAVHRLQHVLQRVGLVGVVVEDGVVLAGGGDDLHAALDAVVPGQRVGALRQRHTQIPAARHGVQRVVDGELGGDAHLHMGPLRVRLSIERHAAGAELYGLGLQIRVGVDGVGEFPGAFGILQQPGMPRVIGIIHADVAAVKQNSLGVAIFLHGAVEIQMILTEIGKNTHGKADAVDPVQHQRVGGYLHDGVGAAGVGHPAQQLLQLEGLRRGALRVEHLAADHVLDGADETHLGAGLLLQNALDEIGGGGLAAGAGNADHSHLPGGVVKPVAGDDRQRPAGVLHQHIGDAAVRRLLADHAGGALFLHHGDILVAVGGRAGDGDEQAALHSLPGVVADIGDVGVQVGGGLQNRQAVENVVEFHRNSLLCSILPPL